MICCSHLKYPRLGACVSAEGEKNKDSQVNGEWMSWGGMRSLSASSLLLYVKTLAMILVVVEVCTL